MKKILQVVNVMDRAGIETILMNYYRNIDHEQVQFDFLTHRPEDGRYDEEIREIGGEIFQAPRLYPKNYYQYFKFMTQFFKDHPEYEIVHAHIDAMSFFPLLAAKLANVPNRIAHSHTTKLDKDFKYPIKWTARKLVNLVTTRRIACGDDAGKFLFQGKAFDVIKNCIEVDKFKYNLETRERLLEQYNLKDKFVMGHVGRFNKVKNHMFLIEVFEEIVKAKPDTALVLVGVGEEFENVQNTVESNELIKDKVLFIGESSSIHELMNMLDVFCLPSIYEGIPVVGIEAQYNGLKCIFSDRVPQEVNVSQNSEFVKLDKEQWVRICLSQERNKRYDIVDDSYNVKTGVKTLMDLYKEL